MWPGTLSTNLFLHLVDWTAQYSFGLLGEMIYVVEDDDFNIMASFRTEKEVGGMEQAHEGVVWSLSWHPLGHILASGSNDHSCKFWTRNRPGDKMRDKYNLNLLPKGQEDNEYDDVDTNASIPGFGFEPGMNASQNVASSIGDDEIPGLGDDDSETQHRTSRKIPFAKPVPQHFADQWNEKNLLRTNHENQNEEMRSFQPQPSDFRYSGNNQPPPPINNQLNGSSNTFTRAPQANVYWSRGPPADPGQRQFLPIRARDSFLMNQDFTEIIRDDDF